jgi:hypothetical protein
MKLLNFAICFFLIGCATQRIAPNPTPLNVSMLPIQVDVDSVLPEAKKELVSQNPKAVKFEPMLFDPPSSCLGKDQTGDILDKPCQSGMLIDEVTFSQQNVSDQAKLSQLITTQNSARTFFTKEFQLVREAESSYQKRIVSLDEEVRKLQTPTLWSRISYPVGVLSGIILTTVIVYAVSSVK